MITWAILSAAGLAFLLAGLLAARRKGAVTGSLIPMLAGFGLWVTADLFRGLVIAAAVQLVLMIAASVTWALGRRKARRS